MPTLFWIALGFKLMGGLTKVFGWHTWQDGAAPDAITRA